MADSWVQRRSELKRRQARNYNDLATSFEAKEFIKCYNLYCDLQYQLGWVHLNNSRFIRALIHFDETLIMSYNLNEIYKMSFKEALIMQINCLFN